MAQAVFENSLIQHGHNPMTEHMRHLFLRLIVGLIRITGFQSKAGWKSSRRRADDLQGM